MRILIEIQKLSTAMDSTLMLLPSDECPNATAIIGDQFSVAVIIISIRSKQVSTTCMQCQHKIFIILWLCVEFFIINIDPFQQL